MEVCFFTSGILSSFSLLLRLSGSWILYFPLIEVSKFFFLLFLRRIRCLSGVTHDKISPCPDIPERLEFFLLISISLGFSILVLFSYKLSDEIDLDLFTAFNVSPVSIIWGDLYLSNDLPFSDLLLLDISFFFWMLVISLFYWLCQYLFLQWKEWWLYSPY